MSRERDGSSSRVGGPRERAGEGRSPSTLGAAQAPFHTKPETGAQRGERRSPAAKPPPHWGPLGGGTQRSRGGAPGAPLLGRGRSPRGIDSGLSLDAEGRFLHRGEPITHPRILELLRRSFRREPDGRYAVSIGREMAYVALEAEPYAIRAVLPAPGDGVPRLLLSDGGEEPIDPATLLLGRDGVLRCTVKGDHPARFTRAGQLTLGALLEEDPPGSGAFALLVNGRRWPIHGPG